MHMSNTLELGLWFMTAGPNGAAAVGPRRGITDPVTGTNLAMPNSSQQPASDR